MRVEDEIRTKPSACEGHVLFCHNLPHSALLRVPRGHLVPEHRRPLFQDADLHATPSIGSRIGIHCVHAPVLAPLRFHRDIAVASNLPGRRGLRREVADQDGVLLDHRAHPNQTVRIQLIVVLVRLPLNGLVVKRVAELRLGARDGIQELFLQTVAVPVHCPEHAALEGRRIQDHRVLLVLAAIHRDGDDGVLAVGQASSASHHLVVHPGLTHGLLRRGGHHRNGIEALLVVRVIPRGRLLLLRDTEHRP